MTKAGGALLASIFLLGASAAQAADLRPVMKAPVAPVAFSWTGFYIGGHVGAIQGRSRFDAVTDGIFPGFLTNGGVPGFGLLLVPSRIATLPAVSASDTNFMGGGQLGYNWQTGSVLFGLEGDASWTAVRAGSTFGVVDPAGYATLSGTYTTQIDWTASLRGRVGYTFGRVLLYATGGAAFGGGKVNSGFTLANPIPLIIFPAAGSSGTTTRSASFTAVGWTIGGGLEWAFSDAWSLAGEYRYSDYGWRNVGLATTDPSGALGLPALATNMRLTTNEATLRLNYRFWR